MQNGRITIVQELLSTGSFFKEVNYFSFYLKSFFGSSQQSHVEISKFNADPIEYILTHNHHAKDSLKALKNIESELNVGYIDIIEGCLESLPEEISNLYDHCGMSAYSLSHQEWSYV